MNAGIDSSVVGFYPTGINDIAYTEQVVIYPNPAQSKIQVSCTMPIIDLVLMDMMGQVANTTSTNGKRSINVDVSGMPAGVYFVKVTTERGSGVAKVVVNK